MYDITFVHCLLIIFKFIVNSLFELCNGLTTLYIEKKLLDENDIGSINDFALANVR